MENLKYILSNVLLTVLMVAGFVFDNHGARNVATAWIWLSLVLSFISLSDLYVEEIRKRGKVRSYHVSGAVFLLHFMFLAWFGEFLLAGIHFISYTLISAARSKAFAVKSEVA